ncbi:hypothetical protein [Thiobacillus denitrificans]|uniref:hypothetical protein n=1 Tax=Thiobacillus denitrificans TaxID=36861 RepID=UPI00035FF230|nr:hypothetical protein [Thiobacillus denitrificans]
MARPLPNCSNQVLAAFVMVATAFASSPAYAKTPKWVKKIGQVASDAITAPAKVPLQITREAGKTVGGDVGRGLAHASQEAIEEVKKAEKSVGGFAKEHKKEILTVAVVAGAGWVACADGCTILLAVGDAYVKVGSIAAGAALATNEKKQESPRSPGTPSYRQMAKEVDKPPTQSALVASDSLKWKRNTLLTTQSSRTAVSDLEQHGETVSDTFREILIAREVPNPISAFAQVTFSPSVSDAPVYNEDREISARLSALLTEATRSQPYLLLEPMKPADIAMPHPPGPEFKENGAVTASAKSVTINEAIEIKAGLLGTLTGLPPEEVLKRTREGLRSDLRSLGTDKKTTPK